MLSMGKGQAKWVCGKMAQGSGPWLGPHEQVQSFERKCAQVQVMEKDLEAHTAKLHQLELSTRTTKNAQAQDQ